MKLMSIRYGCCEDWLLLCHAANEWAVHSYLPPMNGNWYHSLVVNRRTVGSKTDIPSFANIALRVLKSMNEIINNGLVGFVFLFR